MPDLNDISVLPAIILALCIGLAIWADVRTDLCRIVSGRNVVLGAIGAWYLIEALILPAELRTYSQRQYNLGIFYVGLAFAAFLLGYHYSSGCQLFLAL